MASKPGSGVSVTPVALRFSRPWKVSRPGCDGSRDRGKCHCRRVTYLPANVSRGLRDGSRDGHHAKCHTGGVTDFWPILIRSICVIRVGGFSDG